MTMISNNISIWIFGVNFPVVRGDLMLVYDMMYDVEKEDGEKLFILSNKGRAKRLLRNCYIL